MYQFSTFSPLASSKIYLDSIKECKLHLKKSVLMANAFRKLEGKEDLQSHQIENGCSLLKLNLEKEPDVLKILGAISQLSVSNLEKNPDRYGFDGK